jgi:beta-glucanase (GH16 family)
MTKLITIVSCLVLQAAAAIAAPLPPGWRLVWSDEFNYTGLPDAKKWGYDVGGNGWGNNELEYYTRADKKNAWVKDGFLYITARKEPKEGRAYTSARLVTKGKGDWLYGRIEVRARLPAGRGMWPAIWLLPTDDKYGGWPAGGEVDIMENVGFMPDSVFGSIHTQKFNHVIHTQVTKGFYVKDPYTSFHVYAVEWSRQAISFFVDGQLYLTFHNSGKGSEEWPFDQRFHLLLNIAVGGGWGGMKGVDESVFPGSMAVDYVRVYQQEEPGAREDKSRKNKNPI